ncbi:MAG: hypothetical protein EX272_04600 [Chromatiales bacterium]|nr:MAG: hypothetical protein EX272_04600 [Chromatiales bacterium]
MKIQSSWVFDCAPGDIYPHFFSAHMDDSYPIAFRLGIPKPLSCKVLEGEPKVGNTRQCTTDRGYIRQEIVELVADRKLVYEMRDTNVWCRKWVSFLQDTFLLEPIDGDRTRVSRVTEFSGVRSIPVVSTLALWFSLRQAHRYAAKNWRRLSTEMKQRRASSACA